MNPLSTSKNLKYLLLEEIIFSREKGRENKGLRT